MNLSYHPVMKCILSHTAAYLWLMRHVNSETTSETPCIVNCFDATIPCDADVRKMRWFLDLEDVPLDFLDGDRSLRRYSAAVRPRVSTLRLPPQSCIPIASGIDGIDLYCSSPELCFVQMCQRGDVFDAIFHGMALVSEYRLDSVAASGIVHREGNDRQLTTVAQLASYLDDAPAMPGVKLARRALPFVLERSRSPKETGIAMLYGLPQRLGGMALGTMSLNPELRVFDGRNPDGSERTSSRYPDILVVLIRPDGSTQLVAFDYDSEAVHQSSWKVLMDSRRRNALATIENLTHYAIRKEDAQDYRYMVLLGDRARRTLGLRPWPQVRGLPDNADAQLHARKLDNLRFELWTRFVRMSPL